MAGRPSRVWNWVLLAAVPVGLVGTEVALATRPHHEGLGWTLLDLGLLLAPLLALGVVVPAYRRSRTEARRRTTAEAQAVRQRTFLETVLASIGSGILVTDTEGRLLLANREAGRLSGPLVARAEVVDRWPALASAVTGVPLGPVDTVLAHPQTGDEVVLETVARPVTAPDGSLLGAVMAVQDVTARRQAERDQAYLASLVQASQDAIVGMTLDGTIQSWNPGAERLYGYAAAEVLGRSVDLLMPPGVPRSVDLVRQMGTAQTLHLQTQRRCKDGRLVDVSVVLSPLRDAEGRLTGVATISRDVTAARRAEEELRLSQESYRLMFEANPQPMWVYEVATFGFLEVNAAAVAHYGYSREEFLAMTIFDIRPARDVPAVRASAARQAAGVHRSGPWRHLTKDGRLRFVEIVSHGVNLHGRAARLVVAHDVSEQLRVEETLRAQARRDRLTGLPNRLRLTEEAQRLAADPAAAEHTALLLVDLDRFRDVNEGLGHDAGDRLLVEVGRRLRAAVRAGDLVARLGADEFAVLAGGLPSPASAGEVAGNILAALGSPVVLDGLSLPVQASVGVATLRPGQPGERLLADADIAMYRAKDSGGGWAVFGAQDEADRRSRFTLVTGLRAALEVGAVEVHYQPKVDLASGMVTGVEALARWTHPELGPVRPDVFVPLAEQTGLVGELTRQVLRTALTRCRSWAAEGLHVPVAVNVSALSLQQPGFVDMVTEAIAECGVVGSLLTLEITESALAQRDTAALEVLHRLRRLGLGLSVDDFGTGFSAMTYLKDLPVTEMKIDRAFVHGLASDERDASIVATLVSLARTLRLTVVAEGVEDEAVRARLRDLGCDQAQGYGIHVSAAPATLLPWLRRFTGPRPSITAPSRGGAP